MANWLAGHRKYVFTWKNEGVRLQTSTRKGNANMPGAYAHITLVNHMPQRLESIPGFPTAAIVAVRKYLGYCELGAVSPDYPYLAIGDAGAAKWADEMHYTRTGEMVHAGTARVRGMSGGAQQKCLAWLLGYAAHVATDVTIHPVVERRVGSYAQNKGAHRTCEMHQDAYIFQSLNLDDIGRAEHLDHGIARCGTAEGLDAEVKALWSAMLDEVHPESFTDNPPDIDKWHRGFLRVVDLVEEGGALLPFARHVAAGSGFTYPAPDAIDTSYIEDLDTPAGRENYDMIFEAAKSNVGEIWLSVARGVLDADETYRNVIANWNLDTGRDANGVYAFWS